MWRNIDIDQLNHADLLTHGHDARTLPAHNTTGSGGRPNSEPDRTSTRRDRRSAGGLAIPSPRPPELPRRLALITNLMRRTGTDGEV